MNYNQVLTMEWSEWVTQKYIEFRGNAVGRERTITDFSSYLGVSQPRLTQMMKKGSKPPTSYSIINAFVTKYGKKDVFTALGMPVPGDEEEINLDPLNRVEAIAIIRDLAARFDIPLEIHWDDAQENRPRKRE